MDILTEASIKAAHFLGLNRARITQISTETQTDPEQVATLLVKAHQSLYSIMGGHEAEVRP
jgi:hypothetical protein